MMVSGFSSSVDLTLVEICFVVAPGNDLTDTFSFVNDFDSCQPLTFLTIESPNITTALFFILDIELCFLLLLQLPLILSSLLLSLGVSGVMSS